MRVKAKFGINQRHEWSLEFSGPIRPYSYKHGDEIVEVVWDEYAQLPDRLKDVARDEHRLYDRGIDLELDLDFVTKDLGLSVVRIDGSFEPVAVNIEDLEAGVANGFVDRYGNPIEDDHPESPLRQLGLI